MSEKTVESSNQDVKFVEWSAFSIDDIDISDGKMAIDFSSLHPDQFRLSSLHDQMAKLEILNNQQHYRLFFNRDTLNPQSQILAQNSNTKKYVADFFNTLLQAN